MYFERMVSTVLTTSQNTVQYDTEPQTEMGQRCVTLTGTAQTSISLDLYVNCNLTQDPDNRLSLVDFFFLLEFFDPLAKVDTLK